jgi:hypothetical protein
MSNAASDPPRYQRFADFYPVYLSEQPDGRLENVLADADRPHSVLTRAGSPHGSPAGVMIEMKAPYGQ